MAEWAPGNAEPGILFREDGPWRIWTRSRDEPRVPSHREMVEKLQINGKAAVTFLIDPDGTMRGALSRSTARRHENSTSA